MNCTSKNLERVMNFILEHHVDNFDGADFGEYDDESDLLSAIESAIEQLEKEPLYMCNSCHEHFPAEEMDMEVDDDQDLCKNCNHITFNEAPYGND